MIAFFFVIHLHIGISRYNRIMNKVEVLKALNNEKRLNILQWLKEPEKHFPAHESGRSFDEGVCVAYIQEKAGLSQSTTSEYMSMLHKVGMVIATRAGKWTYYRRDEKAIQAFIKQLSIAL